MRADVSRRDFLKFCTAALACTALNPFPLRGFNGQNKKAAYRLGRTTRSLRYYELPTTTSKELGAYNADAVVKIYEQIEGPDPEPANNHVWYRTDDGWLHSSFVQPVRNMLNRPDFNVPSGGFLAEVTVPFTQAWQVLDDQRKRSYRFYYASTYWVNYAFMDQRKIAWYRISDDLYDRHYIVQAEHLRRIRPEELSPIRPEVTDKLVEVNLKEQKMTAYEAGRMVYSARVASGYMGTETPLGEFQVERKQPSRHMAVNENGYGFDLPGVPWVCFILWTGVSLHGTYWHNNYGQPQSHGCINLTPEAAKWVYRWTAPQVPPEKNYVGSDQGTRVYVV